jgi:hypothetical protein
MGSGEPSLGVGRARPGRVVQPGAALVEEDPAPSAPPVPAIASPRMACTCMLQEIPETPNQGHTKRQSWNGWRVDEWPSMTASFR